MAIKSFGFASAGGGAGTDNLDDVTSRGATTTNAITVGGVTIGTEYSLPTLDGSENQVLQTNGTGTLSFATLDFTGGLEYKGAFNATAGTPSLLNAEKGDFYIIDTAGTIYGQTWAVGDHLLINEDMGGTITNSKIDKIDNTDTPASETVAGVIEIATNAEATAGTATDKALVPSNISSLDLSAMDNTTSAFISDITGESLNDLSDVSFTAGAGIDNYVLTYDNGTSTWGAEAVPSATPASETVAGVIEIATNAEAGAGTATDKALVPSNISSLDLSAMDNTTSAFITVGDIPTASHSTAGILETATNAEATSATANDKILTPANLSHIDLSTFDNDSGFISNITNESLNDLSDVSFTAGAGIDNYVLTYDNATTSWGAEAAPTASAASETVAGVIEIATNAEAGAGTATDKALVPSNISSLDLSAMDNTTSAFISDITSESLNDLSDVSFTAGAGIDNYVLTYDNGTSSWGAEAVPGGSPASETTAGIIEIATNAEATAGTATDKALVPSNVSSLDLSAMDNTTSAFISDITSESLNDLSDVSFTAGAGIDNYVLTYDNGTSTWGAEAAPTASSASETVAGVIEIATNAEATAGTATDKALVPSNISSLDLSAMDNTTSAFISGITSESLNDLSDVSFTAGAGIDNYVLTYDHATTSWGAESAPGVYTYSAITADPSSAQYSYHYSCTGTFTLTLPASASGDAGKEIRIKNMGTGTITVDGNASETIDGQTTIDLDTQYSSITLIATGNTPAAWEIV